MKSYFLLFLALVTTIIGANHAFAATTTIPGSVDAGRIGREQENKLPEPPEKVAPTPGVAMPGSKAPEAASKIEFILSNIKIEGATAFKPEEIGVVYKQYIGQKIHLDKIWQIADEITKLYQEKGYFLSRAYVPAQAFGHGEAVVIKVVEGYIGVVELNDEVAENYIVKDIMQEIKEEKPVNVKTLESVTLRLNDIHGAQFRAVIEPLKNSDEAAVKLILLKEKQKISGSVSVDNYNSKFIGPFQDTITFKASPAFQHETTLIFLNAMPWNRERYASFNHNIALSPIVSADIYAGYTKSFPGFTLEVNDIESSSANVGASLNFAVIKQRQENLVLRAKLESKNVATDIVHTTFTRDHIRVLRLNASYDRSDILNGYNFVSVTGTHGLPTLGASENTDDNLSRIDVNPQFNKLELNLTRFQNVGNWTGVTATSMQFTRGSMYSSEQIGYGGQVFGRAYDSSEVVGDQGMLGSLEIRYNGIPAVKSLNFVPYSFFDLGKVWSASDVSSYRSSAGVGMRFAAGAGMFGNLTIAQPLSTKINTPQYGNGKNPRILVEFGVRF